MTDCCVLGAMHVNGDRGPASSGISLEYYSYPTIWYIRYTYEMDLLHGSSTLCSLPGVVPNGQRYELMNAAAPGVPEPPADGYGPTTASVSQAGETSTSKKPAPVFVSITGDAYDVPADTIDAIERFRAPHGFRQEDGREGSFLQSLGNYVKPIGLKKSDAFTGKFFCQAGPACRERSKMIPCAQGSKSNVNKHMLQAHYLRGFKGGSRGQKENKRDNKRRVGAIDASPAASKPMKVATTRCGALFLFVCRCPF